MNPARVIWVATNGTTPATPGGSVPIFASVQAALDSITDNDIEHPYVIKIAPGTYSESTGIDLKDYVDIEGSGAQRSIITAGDQAASNATVRADGVTHARLSNITVRNTGAMIAIAISVSNFGKPDLVDVVADAESSAGEARGLTADISSPSITGLTAIARGEPATGIYLQDSSPAILRSSASAVTNMADSAGLLLKGNSSPTIDGFSADAATMGMTVSAIRITDTASPQFANVFVRTSGGGGAPATVSADSMGTSSFVNLRTLNGKVSVSIGTVHIRDSVLGGGYTLVSGTLRIANSQLLGTNSGSATCFNTFDASFAPVMCP